MQARNAFNPSGQNQKILTTSPYTGEALVRCDIGDAYSGRFVNRPYGVIRSAYTQPPFIPP